MNRQAEFERQNRSFSDLQHERPANRGRSMQNLKKFAIFVVLHRLLNRTS